MPVDEITEIEDMPIVGYLSAAIGKHPLPQESFIDLLPIVILFRRSQPAVPRSAKSKHSLLPMGKKAKAQT